MRDEIYTWSFIKVEWNKCSQLWICITQTVCKSGRWPSWVCLYWTEPRREEQALRWEEAAPTVQVVCFGKLSNFSSFIFLGEKMETTALPWRYHMDLGGWSEMECVKGLGVFQHWRVCSAVRIRECRWRLLIRCSAHHRHSIEGHWINDDYWMAPLGTLVFWIPIS